MSKTATECAGCRQCGSCDAGLPMSCTCGPCSCTEACGHPRCHRGLQAKLTTADLTPAQRLIQARWNLRQIAESWLTEPEPPAGSDEARLLYQALTQAAREMTGAQDALDASMNEKAKADR